MNVSDVVKDANLLPKILDDLVEEAGEDVVQVITDITSNYVKVGKKQESLSSF